MKTSVERVDDTTVKLSVTVEAARVDAAIDHAARDLAQQVKVPGFRPGRVPRRVLETRLGKDALLQEAVREALPQFYSEAVEAEELAVVGPPELDVETFTGGRDAAFSAKVEVRPEVSVPDYAGLQVAHPEWEVTDEELSAQLDALRERFAEVETVQRPVQVGDLALVTITASRNGQPVQEASQEDVLREVTDPEDSDSAVNRELLGASAGAILKTNDTLGDDFGPELAGQEVALTVIVKEVKAKRLPDLDDDFALTASEFDTIDELRDDVRADLGRQKRAYARQELRGKVIEAVCDLVDVPLPATMVTEEQRFRLERLNQQAQAYGIGLEQYIAAVGGSTETFMSRLEEEARQTVKAQLVVDAIGQAEGIEMTREDLAEEIGRQAARLGRPPEELAEFMTHPDRIGALVADAFRRKTIDHVLARVQVLSAPPEEDEHEHEHDHDHEHEPEEA